MIQTESRLKIADNSGAQELLVIRVLGGSKVKYGYVGDIVVGSVKSASRRAVASRRASSCARSSCGRTRSIDGMTGQPSVLTTMRRWFLAEDLENPRGTRVFGPVARELRDKGFMKIVSLAPETL